MSISEANIGDRVTLTSSAWEEPYGVPSGSNGTITSVESVYREAYVNFDNLRGLWVGYADLETERPLTAETADTLERFKALVVQKSLERQVQHSLCQEVQRFLKDDLGLTLPKRKVLVHIEVEVEDNGGDYNTEASAQRLVREAVRAVEGQSRARTLDHSEAQEREATVSS